MLALSSAARALRPVFPDGAVGVGTCRNSLSRRPESMKFHMMTAMLALCAGRLARPCGRPRCTPTRRAGPKRQAGRGRRLRRDQSHGKGGASSTKEAADRAAAAATEAASTRRPPRALRPPPTRPSTYAKAAAAKWCSRQGPARNGRASRWTRRGPVLRLCGRVLAIQRVSGSPLLPVLLAARARRVEHRIAVARAVHVDLRVAQVRDQRKVEAGSRNSSSSPALRVRGSTRIATMPTAARPRARPCARRACRGSARSPPCRSPMATSARSSRPRARSSTSRNTSPLHTGALSTTSHSVRGPSTPACRRPASARWTGNSAGLREPERRRRCGSSSQPDALPLAGEPAGDVGGKRRLAATALRIRDQDRLHDRPLRRTGRPVAGGLPW